MRKIVQKLIRIGLIVIFLAIFYSLSNQIIRALNSSNRLDQEVQKLTELQKRNQELKKQLTEVQSPTFIEQQAREKLNLARDGETLVIIPESEINRVLGINQPKEVAKLPNWQAWLRLFWR